MWEQERECARDDRRVSHTNSRELKSCLYFMIVPGHTLVHARERAYGE
jgi:hypothetical protein